MIRHIYVHGRQAGKTVTQDIINKAKAREYEMKAAQCLAEANRESEKGNKAKAEELCAKADQWMHKMNVALGNATEDMESKPKPPDARYPVDEEWLKAQPATSFMSWAGFKRRLMEKLGIEPGKFYEWDVPSDWIAAWKRAGQKKFKDGRASFQSYIAWEAIVTRKGALITRKEEDKGREIVYTARLPNAANEKIGEFRRSAFDPKATIGWIEYKPVEDTRLTLNSIAAAAKAQMPDVAKLELVRANGYFYVVGEWRKKRGGREMPITSGGIYTNRLGEDNEKFGMSWWVSEVKRVVEAERPYDWGEIK